MRAGDSDTHPVALKRERNERLKLIAGLVIAAAGLVAVFVLDAIYVGFGVALVGTGIVPFEKMVGMLHRD